MRRLARSTSRISVVCFNTLLRYCESRGSSADSLLKPVHDMCTYMFPPPHRPPSKRHILSYTMHFSISNPQSNSPHHAKISFVHSRKCAGNATMSSCGPICADPSVIHPQK